MIFSSKHFHKHYIPDWFKNMSPVGGIVVLISARAFTEATPQATKGGTPVVEVPDTLPATEEELASVGRASKTHSKASLVSAPTSPTESLPSSASKSGDSDAFCPNTLF